MLLSVNAWKFEGVVVTEPDVAVAACAASFVQKLKEWHVLDGALALPEYIIEFDISPEMGKVTNQFSPFAEL